MLLVHYYSICLKVRVNNVGELFYCAHLINSSNGYLFVVKYYLLKKKAW